MVARGAVPFEHRFSGLVNHCQVGCGKEAEAGDFRVEDGHFESRGRELPVLEGPLS